MRESPTASALRIVERDLERALIRVRRLAMLLDDAAERLDAHDREYAHELRSRAWTIALTSDAGAHKMGMER